jgi:hypothetical protein
MKLVAVALLILGIPCNAMLSMAEVPVPFRALMQTAVAEAAMPSKLDAKDSSIQSTTSKHANGGKAERVTGGVLLGTGVAVITTTLILVSAGHGDAGHPGRVWAGIGGGAGMTGVGVTLIVLGSHRRPSN